MNQIRFLVTRKIGGDSLYTDKKWDTTTGDFTMFAVARYASESNEYYSTNAVIGDRASQDWYIGFGWGKIGWAWIGPYGRVSDYDRQHFFITVEDQDINTGDLFTISIDGKSVEYTAESSDRSATAVAIYNLLSEVYRGDFSSIYYEGDYYRSKFQSGSPLTVHSVSTSSNLSVLTIPADNVFVEPLDYRFHLVAVDVDGSADIANSWVDLKNVTQYPNGANTADNNHFPKKLQFGGRGKKYLFPTCEIGEFIAFNKILSPTEREQVEGYLGKKWTGSVPFPSTHPYYENAPDWLPNNQDGSLQAWFDANDSSTINKNFVKKWKDKINQNEFAQDELVSRPGYLENEINGLPAIDFNGINNSLTISSRFGLNKNPDLTIFAISVTDSFRVSLYHEETIFLPCLLVLMVIKVLNC